MKEGMMRKAICIILLCAVTGFADYVPLRELTPAEQDAINKALPQSAPAKPKKPRKVLVVHITKRNGQPSGGHQSIKFGNYFLEQVGKRTGAFEVTVNNDESVFRAENLKAYDAIVFNNTVGVLFEDPVLRQNLLDFVKSGKGFVGFHAAGATFVQYPEYGQFPEYGVMLGGYEDGGHPWSPKDTTYVKVDDTGSPLTAMFDGPFTVHDEAFQFREPMLRDRLHVLLSIDVSKMDTGPKRRILKQRQEDMDFPVSWIKTYGKGRVFYTTMGHNPEAFTQPALLKHFLAGVQFALGDLSADTTPSAELGASRQ
jgi:type 1 glutamine amidotransferase